MQESISVPEASIRWVVYIREEDISYQYWDRGVFGCLGYEYCIGEFFPDSFRHAGLIGDVEYKLVII